MMVYARFALKGHGPRRARLRPRFVGLITIATLTVLGAFAGAAQASSVSSISVVNTPPSAGAGARTVYDVAFVTTTGSLSGANQITVTFEAPTDLSTVVNSAVFDTSVSATTSVGSCSVSGLVATCGLFTGRSIPAGHSVTVELDGVTNSTRASTNFHVTVTTATDTDAATSAPYTVATGGQVTQPTVTVKPPSSGAGARTIYMVSFTTSSTGGLASAANSKITITIPSDANLSTIVNSAVFDTSVSTTTSVGSCSQSGQVATCGLFGGRSIPSGHSITVELDGVTNPTAAAANKTLTVSTTSDVPTITSATYTIDPGGQVTQPTVTVKPPSSGAGARTIYMVSFTTSSTGGLASAANSKITITIPSDANLSTIVNSAVFDTSVSTTTSVGSCSQSGQVATCGLFGGRSIPSGHSITVELDGVTNPTAAAANKTLTVSTTSDVPTITSATYTIDPGGQVTQPTVTVKPPSSGAGARTIYMVSFTTSSTGGLASAANSKITITIPSDANLSTIVNSAVFDTSVSTTTSVGSCSQSGQVATCGLFGGRSIPSGHSITVELDGVTNPTAAAANKTLTVSTTSDVPTITSATYTIDPGGQITNTTVGLSNQSPGAAGVKYLVGFVTSSTGGLSSAANSKITIALPAGTNLVPVTNSAVFDTSVSTTTSVGSCSQSGQVATCGLFGGRSIPSGHSITVELDGVTNPSTASAEQAQVSTTSDLPSISGNYNIGGNPPPPTVTSISPTSGPDTGGTTVTINGTNFTGSTVKVGSAPATIMGNTGTQLTVVSPAGSGTVDVIVTNAGGSSAPSAADRFTYTTPPPPPPLPPASAPPTVSGGAPSTATGNGATLAGTVNPESLATTAFFQYGLDPSFRGPGASTNLYDQSTAPQPVAAGSTPQPVSASLTGLAPGALYHVRLVATNSAGTTFGQDQTFTTAQAAAPPPPVLGKSETAQPVSGTVFIRTASGAFVRLTGAQQIPSGAVIDALHGTLKITTALPGGSGGARDAAAKAKKPKPKGKTQSGNFGGAVFKITQARNGLTSLALVEAAFKGAPSFATCKAHKATDATIAASKTLQLLKASAHGKFRTKGRYSAATVRGTKWTVADRCDGTLTHVITDSVAVTDFVRHKTIILHAGQSYLAKARK